MKPMMNSPLNFSRLWFGRITEKTIVNYSNLYFYLSTDIVNLMDKNTDKETFNEEI